MSTTNLTEDNTGVDELVDTVPSEDEVENDKIYVTKRQEEHRTFGIEFIEPPDEDVIELPWNELSCATYRPHIVQRIRSRNIASP